MFLKIKKYQDIKKLLNDCILSEIINGFFKLYFMILLLLYYITLYFLYYIIFIITNYFMFYYILHTIYL